MTDQIPQRYLDAAPAANSNLPDEIVARALWRYAEQPEISAQAIADEACIHRRMIPQWARKAGTHIRPIGQRPFKPGATDEAVDAYLAAGSLSEAARQLGISRGAVRDRIIAAGITPDSRGAAISTRLRAINDRNDGCITTYEAARIVGVWPSTMLRWLNADRIPGAILTERGDGSGRPSWRVPIAWVEQHRSDNARGGDVLLPAGPLHDWLNQTDVESSEIAMRSGVSFRRVCAVRNGEQATVSFGSADRILTAYGVPLEQLWAEEQIANPISIRDYMAAAA